jgi:MFS family permease
MEHPVIGIRVRNLYYGYILVFAGFAVLLSAYGMLYSFGIFLRPLLQDLGLSRAAVSGAYSLCFFLSGALSISAGWLNDRIGPRIVISCSGILIGSGYLLLSRTNTGMELYLYYGLLVGTGMSGGIAPVLSTITRWFAKNRGLMTGFAVAGVGTGTLIMPIVADGSISAFGWRFSFFLLGTILFLIIVVLAQLFVRDPMSKGLVPYGSEDPMNDVSNRRPNDISLRNAYRDAQLWILFALYACSGFVIQVTLVHITIYAISSGVSARSGALLLSFIGVGSLVGRIFGGGASDRFGSKPVMITASLSMAILFFLLLLSHNTPALVLFAGFFGLVYGEILCLMPILPAELFGLRNHGAILGIITFASTLGGGLGPVAAGAMYDLYGGYELVWIACIGVSVAAIVSSAYISRGHRITR